MSGNPTLSSEKLYEDADELLRNDEFDKAIELFTQSLQSTDKSNTSLVYNNYIGRSTAYFKSKNFKSALDDANFALEINKDDSRAYLKKGIVLYNTKEYQQALEALEAGLNAASGETEAKKTLFHDYINKTKKELEAIAQVEAKKQVESQQQVEVKPAAPPPIKHEWYQTESQVTVSILVKGVSANDVTISSKETILSVQGNNPEQSRINFDFNLENTILPDQTIIKYLPSKIEIKLKKSEPVQWKKLEIDAAGLAQRKLQQQKPPEYPTSSKKQRNWDKIVAEEEKDEKLEGDAALNKLFKDIYANGSEETRKAMNKSFLESGGTVLSTNWGDVGAKKVDIKPPDGMEWKSWDK